MLECGVSEARVEPMASMSDTPYRAWFKGQSGAMVAALSRLIQHPSYYRWDESGAPFGAAIDACLDEALALANELGLRTYREPEGYYGYVEMGTGPEQLAILCHVDVVPAGDATDWFSLPYELDERSGRLYGRGVQDNKGPLVAALYAMKALQEAQTPLRHTIRLILGTDEENLWRCIARYKEQQPLPDAAFTPDSAFPVINAEKRLIQAYLYGPPSDELTLDCGELFNIVPDRACYAGPKQKLLQKQLDKLGFPWHEAQGKTVVLGQQAHASRCDREGINAIVRLTRALLGIGYQHQALGFCSLVVGNDPHVRALLGDISDEMSGKLTLNLASLKMDATATQIGIDIRVPVSLPLADFQKMMRQAVNRLGWRYEEYDHLDPFYAQADSPLVSALCQSYSQVTGLPGQPLASGGVTYARALPNCIPFGARFPHQHSQAHMPNESVSLEDLLTAAEIYSHALTHLQQFALRPNIGPR